MIPRSVTKKLHYDESVLLIVRPSWWKYTPSLASWSGVVALAVFFSYPLVSYWNWGWAVSVGMMLIGSVGILSVMVRRRYTLLLWTNQRIIDIHKPSLFETQEMDMPNDSITDIRYATEGFVETVLRLGTIFIQPAQESGTIQLRGVSRPAAVKERLQRLLRNGIHHYNEPST